MFLTATAKLERALFFSFVDVAKHLASCVIEERGGTRENTEVGYSTPKKAQSTTELNFRLFQIYVYTTISLVVKL